MARWFDGGMVGERGFGKEETPRTTVVDESGLPRSLSSSITLSGRLCTVWRIRPKTGWEIRQILMQSAVG